jgi:hypothetical protein
MSFKCNKKNIYKYSPVISNDPFKLVALKSRNLRCGRPFRDEKMLLLKLFPAKSRISKDFSFDISSSNIV